VQEKHPQNERDLFGHPISTHMNQRKILTKSESHLLLDQLLVLARVAIDLVERQEKAADPVALDEAEIAALVLRDYGDRKLSGVRLKRGMLCSKGIGLSFQTQSQGQEVWWSLILTRHSAGSSAPSPRPPE